MKEYKGEVVHVNRPPPKVIRGLDEHTALPQPARVSVRLDNGQTLQDLPEPTGARLLRGDRITLHADLTQGGIIGPLQKDDN